MSAPCVHNSQIEHQLLIIHAIAMPAVRLGHQYGLEF